MLGDELEVVVDDAGTPELLLDSGVVVAMLLIEEVAGVDVAEGATVVVETTETDCVV